MGSAGGGDRRRRRRGGRSGALDAQPRDHGAERGGAAVVDEDLLEHAGALRLVDDRRLVGLDLDERLALRDRIARPLQPLQDGRLLHRVGEARHRQVDECHQGPSARTTWRAVKAD